MKCEHCGNNEANFFVRSNVNGRVTQVHLCHDCAEKLGYTRQLQRQLRPRSFFGDDFFTGPFSLLEPFFGDMGSRMLTEFPEPADAAGEARAAVQESPRGLVSDEEQAKLQQQRRRNALEAQLKDAVAREDFESAIRLRDELKSLPQEQNT